MIDSHKKKQISLRYLLRTGLTLTKKKPFSCLRQTGPNLSTWALRPKEQRTAPNPSTFPSTKRVSIGLIKAPKNRKIPAACRFENRPKRISVLPVLPGLPLWTTCELSQSRVTNTLGRTVIAHHTVKLKAIQIVFFTRPCLDTLKIRIFFTHA
jgi:hypothetical protein